MYKPAILSRHKYEPPQVEVNLSEEIAGTLRGLKTEGINLTIRKRTLILTRRKNCSDTGHILIDRYKSLQRRNIIEPRIRQRVVLKYKHKVFTKRSHSEPKGVHVGNRSSASGQ